MAFRIKTHPATEPITLTEAKAHLRVDDSYDDTYINTLITTARLYCERFLNQSLITQTWQLFLDSFPSNGLILLKHGPVISLTSIKYYDSDNTEQTLSSDDY